MAYQKYEYTIFTPDGKVYRHFTHVPDELRQEGTYVFFEGSKEPPWDSEETRNWWHFTKGTWFGCTENMVPKELRTLMLLLR